MQKKKEEKINPDIASFGYRMDFGASVTAGVLLFAVFFSFAVLILSQSLFCRRQEQPSSPDPGKGSEKEKQIPPYPFSSFGFDGVQSANFSSLLAWHFGKQCSWRGKVIASGWLCNNIVTFLLMGQEKNLFQVLLLLLDDIDDYFSVYEIVVFELYVALILC